MKQSITEKEIRPVMFTDDQAQIFEERFRVLCAIQNQTIGERFAELMMNDLVRFDVYFNEPWVTQSGLIEALEEKGFSITRQTLRNHRRSGYLPADFYAESKIESDHPNAAKNQRTFYQLNRCIEFYLKETEKE